MADFDRFRAYTAAMSKTSKKGTTPWPIEEVAFAGEPTDGKAEFDAGDTVITKVVFYSGPEDEEAVCGSADVGQSGAIVVVCPDPEASSE
jgi:hypothetical protein